MMRSLCAQKWIKIIILVFSKDTDLRFVERAGPEALFEGLNCNWNKIG